MKKRTLWGHVWRTVLGVVLAPIVLLLLVAGLLCLPPVQRFLVSEAQKYIRSNYGVEVTIGEFRVKPLVDVSLCDVLLLDSEADTLLQIGRFNLDTDVRSLFDKVAKVRQFRLEDVVVDTKGFIKDLRVAGRVSEAFVCSDSTSLDDKYSLVNSILLQDADLCISLPDTTEQKPPSQFRWVFDVREARLANSRVRLPSLGIDTGVTDCVLCGLVDIGESDSYRLDSLALSGGFVKIAESTYSVDSLVLRARMDSTHIDIPRIRLCSGALSLDGSASFDTDDIAHLTYGADLGLSSFCLNDYVSLPEKCSASGSIRVDGCGFDPFSSDTDIRLAADMASLRYGAVKAGRTKLQASLKDAKVKGALNTAASYAADSLFAALRGDIVFDASSLDTSRPAVALVAALKSADFCRDTLSFHLDDASLRAATSTVSGTRLALDCEGLDIDAGSPLHAISLANAASELVSAIPAEFDSLKIDVLQQYFPDLRLEVGVTEGNPLQHFLSSTGVTFDSGRVSALLSRENGLKADVDVLNLCLDTLSLHSASLALSQRADKLDCSGIVDFRRQHGLPDVLAKVNGYLGVDDSRLHVKADSDVSDGIMTFTDIAALVGLDVTAGYRDKNLYADGNIDLKALKYGEFDFGDHIVDFSLAPLDGDGYNIDVFTDAIPVKLARQFISFEGLDLDGQVTAQLHATGPLDSLTITGRAMPSGLKVDYEPMDISLDFGDVPIILDDMNLKVDRMPIYAVDSTMALLGGKFDLKKMLMDFRVESDRFRPIPFDRKDSVAYYGSVLAALDVTARGPVDSLLIAGDVSLLPETDVTYSFGKKNYAHASASGDLHVNFPVWAEPEVFGRVEVDEGVFNYSVPVYPLAPFKIDKGSAVTFDGPLSSMRFDVTATQPAKAIVSGTGGRARNVDFIVGLKVRGGLDDLGLNFLMEAPKDDEVQKEIDSFTDEERNSVAAALLATGMYTSDTNLATSEMGGYALSSMLQKGLNTLAGRHLGNIVDVDLGMSGTDHGSDFTTDYSMKLSKSFFSDRLRLTVGGKVSSNSTEDGEMKSQAMIDDISAEVRVGKKGTSSIFGFHKRDYENIKDGELTKDGIGFRSSFSWEDVKAASCPYGLDLEGTVSWRSNQQLGPDLSATFSKKNLFRMGETFTAKLHGAYFWKVVDRDRQSALNSDNFSIGLQTSLSFPGMVFPFVKTGRDRLNCSTNYKLGYMFENIAGGCTMNKLSAGITYRIQSSPFVMHEFSPFELSSVNTNGTDAYYDSMSSIHTLFNSLAKDEEIPSMGYRFLYNDTSDKSRPVKTRFSFSFKEASNLISGVQALFGRDFNETDKRFLFSSYDQFVKFGAELRNNFRIGEKSSLATRLQAGAVIPYGNSTGSPLSECFWIGGPNSIRAFSARSIGPGAYKNEDYDLYFYHSGDFKLEMNAEYRFPLFWMLEGAVFVDAGNIWDWITTRDAIDPAFLDLVSQMFNYDFDYDDGFKWKNFGDQLALGTGFGIRFVYQSIVVRLDAGIAIHAPYDTGRSGYYNIPHFFKDGVRLNFGIGYPF